MKVVGRTIYEGTASGEALVSTMSISFYGGVDPDTGQVREHGHDLEGQSVAGMVLIFPTGKGSTVGSYTLYRMQANGVAPAAIINAECEPITAVGCIISEIPCVDHVTIHSIRNGQHILVRGNTIEVLDE